LGTTPWDLEVKAKKEKTWVSLERKEGEKEVAELSKTESLFTREDLSSNEIQERGRRRNLWRKSMT